MDENTNSISKNSADEIFEKKSFKKNWNNIGLAAYITLSINLIIIFTVVVLILEYHNVLISDTLITCVYAFFGGEIVTCGLIKIFKLKENNNNEIC